MIQGYAVPDFVNDFWHYWIAALTILGLLFTLWIIISQTTRKLAPGEQAEVMEHKWDGDLQEYNNPLPRWWLYLFYFLIAFSVLYLVLYPGLGKFSGVWNWSSATQWQDEKARVDAEFDKRFKPYLQQDLLAVAADAKAMESGKRLFLTYCSQCHGSGGEGSKDFPNLTDNEWLWGGEPERIKASITNGFTARCLPWARPSAVSKGRARWPTTSCPWADIRMTPPWPRPERTSTPYAPAATVRMARGTPTPASPT